MPDPWNGKVVVTRAPGVRSQYANDFIIGDWVLAARLRLRLDDKRDTDSSILLGPGHQLKPPTTFPLWMSTAH